MNADRSGVESRSLRLARYLKEFVGLRSKTVRDVAEYDSVLWFDEMPQAAGCRSGAWNDDYDEAGPWLEVRKQEFEREPKPHDIVAVWLKEIKLEELSEAIDEGQLADFPEDVEAIGAFLSRREAWATEDRRRRQVQDLYARLFALYHQLQKQSEIVEVVLGIGLMDWQAPTRGGPVRVRRHAVVSQVELTFDPEKSVIRVEAPGEGANLRVEDDMLEAELRPDRSYYDVVEAQLDEVGDAIWDRSLIHAPLRTWAGALSPGAVWSDGLGAKRPTRSDPVVSFAPALILRRRPQTGMVRIYEKLIQNLENEAADVPRGWGQLTDDEWGNGDGKRTSRGQRQPSKDPGRNGGPSSRGTPSPSEIYFPLAANREQRRIVNAIDSNQGVLVQGPPGTGKSHTIANLMCHLLAKGKRVLITAETGRALRVLKRKLPPEIQPLCVSLLGHGGDAFAEVNAAVEGITNRQASYSPYDYGYRIAQIDRELDKARRNIARIDSEIQSLRKDETLSHVLLDGAYQGTASTIAARVADERATFGWFRLGRDVPNRPTVSNAEAAQWLEIRRQYSDRDVEDSLLKTPKVAALTAPGDFARIVSNEIEARRRRDQVDDVLHAHSAYAPIRALSGEVRASLARDLNSLEARRKELALQGQHNAWLPMALKDLVTGRDTRWRRLLNLTEERIGKIEQLLARLGNRTVTRPKGLDPRRVRSDAAVVAHHLRGGGKWKRFGLFTPKVLKGRTYFRKDVFVAGRPADDVRRLRLVCDDLDLEFALSDLGSRWREAGVTDISIDRRLCPAELQPHIEALRRVLEYGDACIEAFRQLSRMSPPIPTPNWMDGEALRWVDLADAADIDKALTEAGRIVELCAQPLSRLRGLHDAHPVVNELAEAIAGRDVAAYSKCHAKVVAIDQARDAQSRRNRIEAAIRLDAPDLAKEIEASLDEPVWDDRLSRWEEAWRWASADEWLRRRSDLDYERKLSQRRHEAEKRKRQLVGDAAAQRAWRHFFQRLSPPQRNALKGWREAVRAMGKGTGRSARIARLKREAREYMRDCRAAIPIWIMPRYLVAEMIDPSPGLYDVVIVDEASQLGIESLFLFYIGKKIIVVGDDQQISPAGVGVADEDVAALQHSFLRNVPHKVALYPQSSVYGNAKIRFGRNIVLREHFRCMPEIIQFSNNLCYASSGTPLDPLRVYSADRLPPIKRRHVDDGYRKGSAQHAVNPPEAEAIVAQIRGCIGDPRYAGMTMGVISLQGKAQARLIESMLLQVLDPEVLEERRLICGDAYAFQGDERHVIFLSMVAAPGEHRIGVLANEAARQRFNVAASRAQDQLWLFHSVELDLLSDRCMRHRLLSYMLDPGREPTDPEEQRFESKFERHVYERITARGFHVRTQVSVGDPVNHRYRIDLVVEGMKGRLAVECDGDRWHGPDRYERDMARQRDLERAGWHFVRIRGSDFYRDRDKAMEPVWAELDRLRIWPSGVDESAGGPSAPKPVGHELRENTGPAEPVSGQPPSPEVPPPATHVREEVTPESTISSDAVPVPKEHMAGPQETPDPPTLREESVHPAIHDPVAFDPGSSGIASYVVFEGRAGPDPRNATTGRVAEGLCRIIDVEGPMLARRAYNLYLSGIGIARMGRQLKRAMNRALQRAIQQGRIAKEDESGSGGLINSIVRTKGSSATVLRERGPRKFEEIPLSELKLMASRLSHDGAINPGSDDHLRAVLEAFDLQRLTAQRRLRFPHGFGAKDSPP